MLRQKKETINCFKLNSWKNAGKNNIIQLQWKRIGLPVSDISAGSWWGHKINL